MRICHIVYECFPNVYAGGVQKMVIELARAQAERGDSVEIWTIGDLPGMGIRENLRLRYFPGRARWSSAALGTSLASERNRFDVIHGHNTFLPLNRLVAGAARRGVRVFYHAHGALDPLLLTGLTMKSQKKRLYVNLVERRNYDASEGVCGLTEEECRQLTLMGTRAAIYEVSNGISLPNPLRPSDAIEFRLRHRIARGSPVVLFVGRIMEKKGIHLLLDAFPRVLERFPDAVVALCGDRNQDVDYVRLLDLQVERCGLQESVRWVGFLDEQGKQAAFAAATLFAHPSYSEGMALAILEAMSVGLPTVVTPGCYMERAVGAGALALASLEPDSIAARIVELIANRTLADGLGAAGARYIREHHTWPAVAERLARIYAGDASVTPFRAAVCR
jgi:glycosyltransferase involved in cell wall biosynthesis